MENGLRKQGWFLNIDYRVKPVLITEYGLLITENKIVFLNIDYRVKPDNDGRAGCVIA